MYYYQGGARVPCPPLLALLAPLRTVILIFHVVVYGVGNLCGGDWGG